MTLYAVILSNANVAIKPSAEQAHLLCRGGARSRNSRISSLAMHYQRCLLSALRRFFTTFRMTFIISLLIFDGVVDSDFSVVSVVPVVPVVPKKISDRRDPRDPRDPRDETNTLPKGSSLPSLVG